MPQMSQHPEVSPLVVHGERLNDEEEDLNSHGDRYDPKGNVTETHVINLPIAWKNTGFEGHR